MEKPIIGISSCLLGNNVRYDGGSKLMHYLRETLGDFVEFYVICPEMECGMGVPREAVRLVKSGDSIELRSVNSNKDYTSIMIDWRESKLVDLKEIPLCGFIFKSKSPSCGVFRAKLYDTEGHTISANSGGMFASRFRELFPMVPIEEEGRLFDNGLRENFIERIFAQFQWKQLIAGDHTLNRIMTFHARWKYTLMAHSPAGQKELGALIGSAKPADSESVYEHYFPQFMNVLSQPATVGKNANVLEHIMGYFRENLSADEKAELVGLIHRYQDHLIPLIVPITLLNHFVRKYQPSYLLDQNFLNPHPLELMLRNHV